MHSRSISKSTLLLTTSLSAKYFCPKMYLFTKRASNIIVLPKELSPLKPFWLIMTIMTIHQKQFTWRRYYHIPKYIVQKIYIFYSLNRSTLLTPSKSRNLVDTSHIFQFNSSWRHLQKASIRPNMLHCMKMDKMREKYFNGDHLFGINVVLLSISNCKRGRKIESTVKFWIPDTWLNV